MEQDRAWWQRCTTLIAAVLLAAVPLLWPAVPPLLDLPGHMASYHVALSLDRSAALQRFFTFHWALIGNLGLDLLIMPVGRVIGVVAGTKLLVTLIPMLTVAGLIACARAAHGRVPATLAFAFPLAYCYPLFFGFVNYCLGAALALFGLALWLRWPAEVWPWRRTAVFALIAATAWLAHAIGWLLLGLACGATELHRRLLIRRQPALRAIALSIATCLPLTLPAFLLPLLGPATASRGSLLWLGSFDLAKWILCLLRDRWLVWDLASAVVLLGLLGLAAGRVLGLRWQPALAWPGVAWLIAYVVLPRQVNGSDYFNSRIIPYAVALLVTAVDTSRVSHRAARTLALAAWVFFTARLAGTTASVVLYDRSWTRELVALDFVRPGARVATFSAKECDSSLAHWFNPRTDHLSAFATFRRDAFVNSLWTLSGLQLLQVHYPAAGAFQSEPSQMVRTVRCFYSGPPQVEDAIARLPHSAFDYLWLVQVPRTHWPHAGWLTLRWSAGDSALYQIGAPPAATSPGQP